MENIHLFEIFNNMFYKIPHAGAFISFLAVMVLSYTLSMVFVSLFRQYLKKANIVSENFPLNKHFSFSIWMLLSLFGVKIALHGYETYLKDFHVYEKIWQMLVITFSVFFLMRIVSFFKLATFRSFEIHTEDEFKYRKLKTQLDFIEKFTVVCLCLTGFFSILFSFEAVRKIGGSFLASAGLAGIILGFAAQKSLSNLIAGFQIAFTQPFKLGDTVVVDGEWGHIKEITLTYIVVKSWDKRNLIVPITYLLEKPFQNWTRSNEKTMGIIYLYADYSLPVEKLREEFMRIMPLSELWDGEAASLYVTDVTERTIQIRALVSAKNADQAFMLKVYVRENLIRFIQEQYPESLPQSRVFGKNIEAS